jgi:AcrR family transcriptional regulator
MTKDSKSKPQSKPKRIRNPVATRAKLLQATVELVSEKGAAALSLKEAARRAKVSRGVAYLHFDDRDQLLDEAESWIAEKLLDGVKRFAKTTSLHDSTFHTTRLVLTHPEASKLMITAAMQGEDLYTQHPLHKLLSDMLREFKTTGKARADMDVEILTYIMFGSIAATIMLGAQHKKADVDKLSERFANEWNRILQIGMFVPRREPSDKNSRQNSRALTKKTARRLVSPTPSRIRLP